MHCAWWNICDLIWPSTPFRKFPKFVVGFHVHSTLLFACLKSNSTESADRHSTSYTRYCIVARLLLWNLNRQLPAHTHASIDSHLNYGPHPVLLCRYQMCPPTHNDTLHNLEWMHRTSLMAIIPSISPPSTTAALRLHTLIDESTHSYMLSHTQYPQ